VSTSSKSPSTIIAIKRILVTLLSILETRLEIFIIEAGQEKERLLGLLLIGLAAVVCFGFALLMLSLWVIIFFWENYRYIALLGLTGFYCLMGFLLWLKLKQRIAKQPSAFVYTLAELAKDREALAQSAAQDEQGQKTDFFTKKSQ
jgi:uncharacterized membrane protein YqjE